MNIFIQFERPVSDEDQLEKAINQAAEAVFNHQDTEDLPANISLSVMISDNVTIQSYNLQYRGVDAPTDVLSFEVGELDPDDGAYYLGDILVSFPVAQEQAENAGHTTQQEIQLLVIHGVLHLLGHDHLEETEQAMMWTAQQEILDSIGNPAKPTMVSH